MYCVPAWPTLANHASQGASTITMQVARNFYLPTEKTFTRKIYEILLAMKIESLLSKDQILELYMNQIYLGNAPMVLPPPQTPILANPSRTSTMAEAAMLAGLPRRPSAYNPIRNPKRATIRQQYIIDRMFENGFITRTARCSQNRTTELPNQATHPHSRRVRRRSRPPADARAIRRRRLHPRHQCLHLDQYDRANGGIQGPAQKASRFRPPPGPRGPEAYIDLPTDAKQMDIRIAEALEDHPDSDSIIAAVVIDTDPKKLGHSAIRRANHPHR